MADFKLAYAKTMKVEGGYANDKDDSGGETWKGIARKYHPNWSGWAIIDSFKNKPGFEANLLASQTLQRLVLEFFKKEFWDVMRLDEVLWNEIAEEMFDTGVNMNHLIAVEFLQRALNATNRSQKDYPDLIIDGRMGSKSIGAINNHLRVGNVLKLLNCQQGVRYMDIARNNPIQEKFMTSWLSRVAI